VDSFTLAWDYLRLDPSVWAGIEQAMADTYAGVFPHETV